MQTLKKSNECPQRSFLRDGALKRRRSMERLRALSSELWTGSEWRERLQLIKIRAIATVMFSSWFQISNLRPPWKDRYIRAFVLSTWHVRNESYAQCTYFRFSLSLFIYLFVFLKKINVKGKRINSQSIMKNMNYLKIAIIFTSLFFKRKINKAEKKNQIKFSYLFIWKCFSREFSTLLFFKVFFKFFSNTFLFSKTFFFFFL